MGIRRSNVVNPSFPFETGEPMSDPWRTLLRVETGIRHDLVVFALPGAAMIAGPVEHVLIWEFRVRAGCEAEFEAAYGPRGAWATLFGSAHGYLGTELFRDPEGERRYLTIDRWESAEAYARFRETHAAEYEALDVHCERWIEYETPAGAWKVVRGTRPAP